MPYYVNAYETYDAYGGPEEGGWWYTVGEPTGQTFGPFDDIETAWEQEYVLRDWVDRHNEGRWPRNSSNGGDWFTVLVEDHEPRPFPEQTPRYE